MVKKPIAAIRTNAELHTREEKEEFRLPEREEDGGFLLNGGHILCDRAANCKHSVSKREKEEKTQQTGKKLKTQTLRRDIIESTRKRYHRVADGRPVLIPGIVSSCVIGGR